MSDQYVYPSQWTNGELDTRGLTLRDHIAIQAMQGMLSGGRKNYFGIELAERAYGYADAMLAERLEEAP